MKKDVSYKITTRIQTYFRCDGGKNPSHHQAKAVAIVEDERGVYLWSGGSVVFPECLSTYDKCLETLKLDYVSVIQTGRSVNTFLSQEIIIK